VIVVMRPPRALTPYPGNPRINAAAGAEE